MAAPPFEGLARLVARWLAPVAIVSTTLAAVATGNLYYAQLTGQAALFLVAVLSWDLFCSPTRELSFGHALFVGGAAYFSALCDTRLGLPPWASVILATLAAAAGAFLLGLIALRLRGAYFAMATMAAQLMLFRTLYLFSGLFGGGEGIVGVRPLVPQPLVGSALASALGVAVFAMCLWFRSSRWAMLLRAVGVNERLARAAGVRAWRLKTLAFAASGALGGLGGALQAHTLGQVTTEQAGAWLSGVIVLLGVLGSGGGVAGVALGALGYFALGQLLLPLGGYDAPLVAGLLLVWTWVVAKRRAAAHEVTHRVSGVAA